MPEINPLCPYPELSEHHGVNEVAKILELHLKEELAFLRSYMVTTQEAASQEDEGKKKHVHPR